MRDLRLSRMIPVAAATGALVAVGCGGRAIDDPTPGEGSGNIRNIDVSNDVEFVEALEDEVESLCRTQVVCGSEYFDSVEECVDSLAENLEYVDFESNECRRDFLLALDCYNEQLVCNSEDAYDECYDLIEKQASSCESYDDYSDDDYDVDIDLDEY